MVSPAVTGLIGDCYVNMGNTKEGISYFEKAAKEAEQRGNQPDLLEEGRYRLRELERV